MRVSIQVDLIIEGMVNCEELMLEIWENEKEYTNDLNKMTEYELGILDAHPSSNGILVSCRSDEILGGNLHIKNTVSIGDVFAVSLPDGRYGAIRVADQIDNSYLIITTPYIGAVVPSIENELLGESLL